MDLSRLIMIRVQRSNCLKLILISVIIFGIYVFYNYFSKPKITGLNVLRENSETIAKAAPSNIKEESLLSLSNSKPKERVITEKPPVQDKINVMITFTNVKDNPNLKIKFRTTVSSLFKFSSVPVNLYILGDVYSEEVAREILAEVADKDKYTVVHLEIDKLAKQVHEIVSEMQKYFSYKPGAYYSDSLFFMSLVIHKVLPEMHRVIMLDCDLKFNADIKDLYSQFDLFKGSNIMGIARDAQPVYRHNFHMYRNKNKGTRVGGPPPDGLTGFNSGVLLLDLDRMRKSHTYNALLSADTVKSLTEMYMFKGHLGDQDFYSLISLEHEELFHVLPCNWNRQLCTWWKNNGYADVFDEYFKCDGKINIYHGNCNTPIPKLEWES